MTIRFMKRFMMPAITTNLFQDKRVNDFESRNKLLKCHVFEGSIDQLLANLGLRDRRFDNGLVWKCPNMSFLVLRSLDVIGQSV